MIREVLYAMSFGVLGAILMTYVYLHLEGWLRGLLP